MPHRAALLATIGILVLLAVSVRVLVGSPPDGTQTAGGSARTDAPSVAIRVSRAPFAAPSGTTSATTPPAAPRSSPTPRWRGGPASRTPPAPPAATEVTTALPAAPTPLPTPLPPPSLDFVLSSLNVLGASHTSSTGKRPEMASGPVRAARVAELIRRTRADVVGFQELQRAQLTTLQRRTDLDFYPGSELGPRDSENSLGWRRDRWMAVERHTIRIPYFYGSLRAMPLVRLRSLSTGLEAWFANFHNPADTATYHHQERFRTKATKIEIALVNQLVATGIPVFVTGDMNERASYFCRFTAGTPMVAARGGSHRGACRAGPPRAVDWIFGSRGVDFTGYYEDRSHLVDITTDHPMLVVHAHIE